MISHLLALAILASSLPALAQEGEPPPSSDTPGTLAQYDFSLDYSDSSGNRLGFKAVNAEVENGAIQLNGVYESEKEGFTACTANIDALSYELFNLSLDFMVAPDRDKARNRMPIIVGGVAYRWLGVFVTDDNRLGLFLNNGKDAFQTELLIQPGRWYTLRLSFDYAARTCALALDNSDGVEIALPDDLELQVITDGMDRDKNFTFTDYSRGLAMHGMARNLLVEGYATTAE